MGIKPNIILLLFGIVSIYSTCKKNCITATYGFKIGIKATPNLDSINILDTIWFDVNEPTVLQSVESGTHINFDHADNLGSNIGFQEVLSATQFRNAANDFNFKLIAGRETANTNSQLFRAYFFAEQNSRYVFKIGVIPLTIGVYRIIFSNAANVTRNNSNCERAGFQIDFKETDQHYYFFPGGGGTSPGGGAYYFKVK